MTVNKEDLGVPAWPSLGSPSGLSPASGSSESAVANAAEPRHCDDYIDDAAQPECLRAFLEHARSPAHGSLLGTPRPPLFADYKGGRVRVVMASRFGDVGITRNLRAEHGYEWRVAVVDLNCFSATAAREQGK